MTFVNSAKFLLVMSLLVTVVPAAVVAKPNSYPGENSTFQPPTPEEVAKRQAERTKRIEERQKRREERRLKRLDRKNNRSN